MKVVIGLVGPPASGKSFVARKLAKLLQGTSGPHQWTPTILDRDQTRFELMGPEFQAGLEGEVRDAYLEEIAHSLNASPNPVVIIDDMNYYRSMRHDLREVAGNSNAALLFIYLRTPLDTCLAWNKQRGRPVPDIVVEDIFDKIDATPRYAWEEPALEILMPLSERDLLDQLSALVRTLDSLRPISNDSSGPSGTLEEPDRNLHEFDLHTRKILNEVASQLSDPSQMGELNAIRKRFLETLKTHPGDLDGALSAFRELIAEKIRDYNFDS